MGFKKGLVPWNKGISPTKEQIKKQKESWRRTFLSNPEMRRKMRESHKGHIPWNKGKSGIYSKETIERQKETYQRTLLLHPEIREKMSLAKKGKPSPKKGIPSGITPWNLGISPSEETRKKISEANKGKTSWNKGKKSGKPSWNKGIPMREESKLKMAKAVKKAWSNPNLRKRQSESHKGKHLSPKTEFKKGMPSIFKGKHQPESAIKKLIAYRNTPEYKEWARQHIFKQFESGDFPKLENTGIERKIKEELIRRGYKEGIDFIHQYKCLNKFMCDFGFPKQKVVVEAYGDYWHCNPKLYPFPKNQHQIKALKKDRAKEGYIKKADNGSWIYLVLWESDIEKDIKICVDKIEEALKNKPKSDGN